MISPANENIVSPRATLRRPRLQRKTTQVSQELAQSSKRNKLPTIILNKLALPKRPPERTESVRGVAVVVFSEGLAHVLRELGPVPEGDGREEVVRDVVVRDLQFVKSSG